MIKLSYKYLSSRSTISGVRGWVPSRNNHTRNQDSANYVLSLFLSKILNIYKIQIFILHPIILCAILKVGRKVQMKITLKEIENTGAGAIREDLIRKTYNGKIYNVRLYRNDRTIQIAVLFYNRGGSKLIGMAGDNREESIREFDMIVSEALKNQLLAKNMTKASKTLQMIRAAMALGYLFTMLNVVTYRTQTDIKYIITDIILMTVVRWIYKKEEKRYERQ